MQVTITVDLDDGSSVTRTVEVDSADNPRFWSQGFDAGVDAASEVIQTMMHAVYGTADHQGIHIVRSKP